MSTKGWLPYGSSDSSVIFQHDLKSALVPADMNSHWSQLRIGSSALTWDVHGSVVHGKQPTHDSVLGFKPVDSTDGTTEVGYNFSAQAASIVDLINQGQISFEIESDWLCVNDAASGTSGADLGAESQSCISWLAAAAPAGSAAASELAKTGTAKPTPIIFKNSVGFDYRNHMPTATGALAAIYSPSKTRFILVNFGWKGNYVWYSVDGVVVNFAERGSDGWTNPFNNMYLGCDRGTANTFVDGYWMRNLQISNEAPRFDLNYNARQITVCSDSLFDNETAAATTSGDLNAQFRIFRGFEKKGMRCNLTIDENGGFQVDSGAASTLHDRVTAVLDTKPSMVILQGGTNDCDATAVPVATFETEYKSLVEKLIGVNGNTSTASKIYCCTVPSRYGVSATDGANSDTYQGRLESYNAVIRGLESWFTTNYGSSGKELYVVDSWTALGGRTPTEDAVYKGQLSGTFDDVHFACNGNRLYGDAISERIMQTL
ncbi:MAG: SGNH/GDSL hydrolase family protein [Chloroflexota bacterium]